MNYRLALVAALVFGSVVTTIAYRHATAQPALNPREVQVEKLLAPVSRSIFDLTWADSESEKAEKAALANGLKPSEEVLAARGVGESRAAFPRYSQNALDDAKSWLVELEFKYEMQKKDLKGECELVDRVSKAASMPLAGPSPRARLERVEAVLKAIETANTELAKIK